MDSSGMIAKGFTQNVSFPLARDDRREELLFDRKLLKTLTNGKVKEKEQLNIDNVVVMNPVGTSRLLPAIRAFNLLSPVVTNCYPVTVRLPEQRHKLRVLQ
ncbi:hypothetical protein CBL_12284 [Carabus blaptoides fortunei]